MHPHVVRMINVCQLVIQRDLVKLSHQHDYSLFFSGTFTNIIFQSKNVTFHGESLKHKRCRPSESILTLASRTKRPWNTALWHRNAVLVFCHLPATPLVFKSTNISLPFPWTSFFNTFSYIAPSMNKFNVRNNATSSEQKNLPRSQKVAWPDMVFSAWMSIGTKALCQSLQTTMQSPP